MEAFFNSEMISLQRSTQNGVSAHASRAEGSGSVLYDSVIVTILDPWLVSESWNSLFNCLHLNSCRSWSWWLTATFPRVIIHTTLTSVTWISRKEWKFIYKTCCYPLVLPSYFHISRSSLSQFSVSTKCPSLWFCKWVKSKMKVEMLFGQRLNISFRLCSHCQSPVVLHWQIPRLVGHVHVALVDWFSCCPTSHIIAMLAVHVELRHPITAGEKVTMLEAWPGVASSTPPRLLLVDDSRCLLALGKSARTPRQGKQSEAADKTSNLNMLLGCWQKPLA